MCRSIKVLRKPGEVTTPEEVSAAALQFVRKISGFRKPSKANTEAFDHAVEEVAEASRRLLETLGSRHAESGKNKPAGSGTGIEHGLNHRADLDSAQ